MGSGYEISSYICRGNNIYGTSFMQLKYLFILPAVIVSIFTTHVSAQIKTAPVIEWQKSIGGNNTDVAYCIRQTSDGGYIVAGSSSSNDGDVTKNQGDLDYWVVKLSSVGVIEWQKSIGGTNVDVAISILQTTDKGYIVAGYSYSFGGDVSGHFGITENSDFWVVKLTSNGQIEWDRALGGSGDDKCFSVHQTSEGGFIFAGYTTSVDGLVVSGNHGMADYWIVKLSNTGILEWQKTLGGTLNEHGSSIQKTTDGGYIVAGSSSSNNGDVTDNHGKSDFWIAKLTNVGSIEWQKSYGGSSSDSAHSVLQTADGGYIIVGETLSSNGDVSGRHGQIDYWVLKLTSTGLIDWQKCLGGSSMDVAYSVGQTTDGGFIVAGSSWSVDGDVIDLADAEDYWIVKLTTTGSIEWQKALGGSVRDQAYSIQELTGGGYIVAGTSGSHNGDVISNYGGENIWIVKLSPEGTSSVESKSATKSTVTITPNPASTAATLSLESDEAGACEVQIISLTGAALKEYSTHLVTGKQEIVLTDLESLPSGMYEVVVKRTGHHTLRTKLVIER
jgi:hypothetical protein